VQHHLLHDERRVVLGEARPGAEDVHAGFGERARHRQKLQRGGGMHEDRKGLRGSLWQEADALEVHHPLRAREPVNLSELGVFRVLDVHPLGCHFLWTQSAWWGAFLVLVHSSSIALLTDDSFLRMEGVVVSTAS